MYVVVEHTISDADGFWNTAERELPNLPATLKLHQSTPTADWQKAYCLWEVDSIDSLKSWMEPALSNFSSNEYHEVLAEKAIGLPQSASTVSTTAAG
jgi:hypothetical protein